MRIYVGNLSYNTTEEQLTQLFSAHGTVESASVITDKYSGRSKGFGFVEMADNEQANAAINALNGSDFDGRSITVNEARERAERTGGPGGGRGGYGGGGAGGGRGGFGGGGAGGGGGYGGGGGGNRGGGSRY